MDCVILLVEDEPFKQRHIEQYVKGVFPSACIETARSVTAAIDIIDERIPDVLLLDMSLPTFDIGEREGGGRPQGFGGIEVIRHMKFSGIACPIIVVTGYEAFPKGSGFVGISELEAELKAEFPEMVEGVLYFNSAFDDWKDPLVALIRTVLLRREKS
ncbi:response regulator [Mesorhizobium sp. WSM4904]|uniref:response regulator n=1 Tax=Mesorhizobium sp. WSM4904 TaxID=3038545 RepID=UPI002418682E|nr:response regulator [Mesorhizobium sp. WSM4904]WFP65115.1 response regulator [Mesorhizobium sp. WSM4904]